MKRLGRSMPSPPKIGQGGKIGIRAKPENSPEAYLERLMASLPDTVSQPPHQDQITYLPRYSITPNREQPRRHFDPESLEDLAESIRVANGIIQPLIVRRVGAQRYEIIAGERRWRAADIIDLEELPCIIRNDVNGVKELMFSLIENIQRNQLNPIEEARGIRRLIDEFDLSHKEAANAVGRSRSAVTNLLRLLDLVESIQEALADGRIEMGHARALAALDHDDQASLLGKLLENGWSVRQTESAVRQWKIGQNNIPKPATPDPDQAEKLSQLSMQLKDYLGKNVSCKLTTKGHVKLELTGIDDLAAIAAACVVRNNKRGG